MRELLVNSSCAAFEGGRTCGVPTGGIRGGRVYGRWPGLSRDRLYEQRDLAVTTDFRDVFTELLTARMRVPAAGIPLVFPGYQSKERLGLIA